MLSLFAFLIALGIVVDDAIVIGENIYAHREQGKPFVTAAIEGTMEVMSHRLACQSLPRLWPSHPLMFVTGTMGKFFAVIPVAVIAMLIISLLESTFILPCHLAHGRKEPFFLTAGLNQVYDQHPEPLRRNRLHANRKVLCQEPSHHLQCGRSYRSDDN